MTLIEEIRLTTISAGGPGSGRHPEEGSLSSHMNHLRSMGFKPEPKETGPGIATFVHPDISKAKEAAAYFKSQGFSKQDNRTYRYGSSSHYNLDNGVGHTAQIRRGGGGAGVTLLEYPVKELK